MDTLTHTLMGGTLVGVATLDPYIDATTTGFVVTIVGASLIADTDTILKIKNNATYIRHHRGITHSLPFTFFVWPVLLTLLAHLLFDLPVVNTYLWVQLAVFLHVFVDIFNSYGTQALRPIDYTWIQIGSINTIDIFIIVMHVLYFALWALGFSPVILFIILYAILSVYYVFRLLIQKTLMKKAQKKLTHQSIRRIFVMPTLRFSQWRIVVVTDTHYFVGRSYRGNIQFYDTFSVTDDIDRDLKSIIKFDINYRAFTFFSSVYRYEVTDLSGDLVEVRYIDLRYLKDGHYPFVCIMIVDTAQKEVLHSYTGWVFSEEKLQTILKNT